MRATSFARLIRETTNVPSGYQRQVDEVAGALAARDQDIVDQLRRAGQSMGGNATRIDQALAEAGLIELEPATLSGSASSNDHGGRLAALEAFARQHGFRG